MTEPKTKFGITHKLIRSIQKTLATNWKPNEYSVEIKVLGGATRLEIIILDDVGEIGDELSRSWHSKN